MRSTFHFQKDFWLIERQYIFRDDCIARQSIAHQPGEEDIGIEGSSIETKMLEEKKCPRGGEAHRESL